MPQEPRFQHHGEPAETREQWAARQQAASERPRAQAPARPPAVAPKRPSRPESPQSASRRRHRWRRGLAPALLVAGGIATLAAFGSFSPSSPSPAIEKPAAREPPASGPTSPAPPVNAPPPADERDIWGGLTARRLWADDPPIAPQPDGWWCLCYKTRTGADHTACRRLAGECTDLLTLIQTKDSASIQRGSATPAACRHVRGDFPWLRLGHREAWAASEYPGATQAHEVCAL